MSWSVFKLAWARNGTPNTLGSSGDDIDITDLTAYSFNQFLLHTLPSSSCNGFVTYDNNGNTDYANRRSENGGADSTQTSQSSTRWHFDGANDNFMVCYSCNIDSEEKLDIIHTVTRNSTGAANAPLREEIVAKVDTTTNTGQYTRIDVNNTDVGSFNTNSNLSAIGTN